jgi:serine/threonine-protein kinase
VHHAHQRGVLHRDLKPGNILLDTRGEPYVTDFGLAKRTGPANVAPGVATPLPQKAALTHTGAVLGTPAYMAPEQAAGGRGSATVAADVYGLGAILYELLTGKPPFTGTSPLDILRRVVEEEPVRPRALNPQADRDLETICLKCLQKEPGQRYASAQELADDLRRFLDGEPIRAHPVTTLARAWRWARRRPVVAGLLAALAAALAGGLGLTTWQWQRAERHAREVEHQRDLLRQALALADQRQRDSEDSFRLAHGAVNDFFLYVDQELARAPGLQPLRQTLLKQARAYFENFRKKKGRGQDQGLRVELADAHFNVARICAVLGAGVESRAAYREALALYRELHRSAPGDLAVQRRLAHTLCNLATVEDVTGAKLSLLNEAQDRYAEFLRATPGDRELRSGLGNTLNNLGTVHVTSGRLVEARRCLERAAEIQEELVRDAPGEFSYTYTVQLAAALANLGTLAGRLGEHPEAVRCFRRVSELWDVLLARGTPGAPADPERQAGLAAACHNLAIALSNAGRRQEAVPVFRRVLELRTRLADANPHVTRFQAELGAIHTSLGILHAQEGDFDDALACYRAARTIYERLAGLDKTGSAAVRKDLAASHFNVGVAHGARGRRPQELRAFEKARGLQETLLKSDPDNLDYRLALAQTLNNIGYNLWATHRLDEARPVLHQAIATLRVAVARAPRVPAYRSQLSTHYELLSHVERDAGRTGDAIAALLKRQELWPDDAEQLYRTACSLALVAEKRLATAEHADLVLRTLRQAVGRGFRDINRLRKDAALGWVRGRDDFQALLRELESRRP